MLFPTYSASPQYISSPLLPISLNSVVIYYTTIIAYSERISGDKVCFFLILSFVFDKKNLYEKVQQVF